MPKLDELIREVRGQKIMLDLDLARVYGVETKALNRAVKRNADRFPKDFMFQISSREWENLRYQIGTLKSGRGRHRKYLPYAFTEHGAIEASSLRSQFATSIKDKLNWSRFATSSGRHRGEAWLR